MIKPDQVPDEVADAIRHCFHTRGAAKVEIAAALNAWPDAKPAWFLPQGKVYMLPAPWENKKWENSDE